MSKKTPSDARRSGEPESQEIKRPVTPVREKIGEKRGNLQRRGDWFRQRSGDPPPPPDDSDC